LVAAVVVVVEVDVVVGVLVVVVAADFEEGRCDEAAGSFGEGEHQHDQKNRARPHYEVRALQ
jgi:hypothetical protein